VVAGGRSASQPANASADAVSSANAAHWPAGPAVASRWPGSGLAAGVRCRARPSGNSTAFRRVAPGSSGAAGAAASIAAAAVSAVIPANRQPAFGPRPAASMTAITGTAGQAVALSAQAMPVTMAALPGARAAAARATHSSAITAMSVPPFATCNDTTGEAAANAVAGSARRDRTPEIRNARYPPAAPARNSHSRGLPAQPARPAADGKPNTAISGSYGSYVSTPDSRAAGRYGVPWRSSSPPARATTVSDPSPARPGRPAHACQASGPTVAQARAITTATARCRGTAADTAAAAA
jgi:hypothetical protein